MTYNRISKSQYLRGLQCPKSLWFYRHRPDLAPQISDSQQALFDAGHEVGELAQKYFNGGVEITEDYFAIDQAIASTQKAINDGQKVIFEATAASTDGAFSRIDILKKVNGSDAWDLIEVKMATTVKDYHIDDMTLQRYAFIGAGYKIRKSILMHINNQYVRQGDLDLSALFTLEDCTEQVEEKLDDVGGNVAELLKTLNNDQEPTIVPGNHCYSPFECDYTGHCWPPKPDDSVHDVFRSGWKLDTLLAQNITRICDVPDDMDMTAREQIVVQSCKSQQIYKDKQRIQDFLDTLEYPLYFLDYETIGSPVPLFDQSRPYQQIPFQFSLHIQKNKNGPVEHVEFLHTEKTDPRPDLIKKLIDNCGNKGSVVVYNQAFEKRINYELGQSFPAFKTALYDISNRMVDIMGPFRSRYLYHPDMKCSASLKSVLPAFVPEMSYDNLAIGDGGTASQLYLSCLKDTIAAEEQKKIFDDLRNYCGQDTLAEVKLLEVMYSLI